MDYSKVKKCIREYLDKNNERISDRAEARVIMMSQKGYIAMMNHNTMTVKKLEKLAQLSNKPVSYFFVNEDKTYSLPNVETHIANEGNDDCENSKCLLKLLNLSDKLHKAHEDIIELQKKLLETSPKKETTDVDSVQLGEDTKQRKIE